MLSVWVHLFQIPLHGVDFQSFLAVLEYLYTDNCATLNKIPVENVLVLADQLCLPHLVQICEVQMHKGLQQIMQTQISENIAKEWLDVLAFSKVSVQLSPKITVVCDLMISFRSSFHLPPHPLLPLDTIINWCINMSGPFLPLSCFWCFHAGTRFPHSLCGHLLHDHGLIILWKILEHTDVHKLKVLIGCLLKGVREASLTWML